MHRITLVATGHRPTGRCNPNELYKLIERVAPDIIFEEIPPNKFTPVYRGLLSDSLETFTIKKYLQNHPIPHLPVDLEINESIEKPIRSSVSEMNDIFENSSKEYSDLTIQHFSLTERLGFEYLNSDDCCEILERKLHLEEEILKKIDDDQMSQTQKDWLKLIERRRKTMIDNIYEYSRQNKFNAALFLIGAEHRKSIIDKVLWIEKNSKTKLNWNFNYLI